jgi:hypothetical protein
MFVLEVPGTADPRLPMAIDELPNGQTREGLLRQARQQRGDQGQVSGLLQQRRAGVPGGQSRGEGFQLDQLRLSDVADPAKMREVGEDDEDDERIENLKKALAAKGMDADQIKTVCDAVRAWRGDDLGIGPGGSAKFGGASTGKNFGGALSEGIAQRSSQSHSDSPASRDRALTYEEEAGLCPYAGVDLGIGRDSRMSFDQVFDACGPGSHFAAQEEARRRRSGGLAMDAAGQAASDELNKRFGPNAARIRHAW